MTLRPVLTLARLSWSSCRQQNRGFGVEFSPFLSRFRQGKVPVIRALRLNFTDFQNFTSSFSCSGSTTRNSRARFLFLNQKKKMSRHAGKKCNCGSRFCKCTLHPLLWELIRCSSEAAFSSAAGGCAEKSSVATASP